MLATPLPTVEIDPPGTAMASVIWLHGLGADGHDFEPIVPELRLPKELGIRFVFPHAPEMEVTAFGNQRARAWFDFSISENSDTPGLKKSVAQVRDLIQAEIDNGIAPGKIVLAGFSQGGVVAFATGLHYPKPLAGILALSTFMAPANNLGSETTRPNAGIPIWQCHGQHDMVLPLALGLAARDRLTGAGYEVDWHQYPMGHEVCLPEIQEISRWLQKVLALDS